MPTVMSNIIRAILFLHCSRSRSRHILVSLTSLKSRQTATNFKQGKLRVLKNLILSLFFQNGGLTSNFAFLEEKFRQEEVFRTIFWQPEIYGGQLLLPSSKRFDQLTMAVI